MTTNPHTADEAAVEETADFDAWREQERARRGAGKTVTVFGQRVTLPLSLPLGMTLDRATDVEDEDEVRRIVGTLYGADALDHWVEAGAELADLQVLLTYAIAYASGRRTITFSEAAELAEQAQAKAGRGKATKKRKTKRGPGGGSPATGR